MKYKVMSGYGGNTIDFSGTLSEKDINEIAQDIHLKIIQTNTEPDENNWPLLEEYLFKKRPDISLRVYGPLAPNLAFLKKLPSLKSFYADCLTTASGLENLEYLTKLQHLSIGIDSLDSFDFLNSVQPGLMSLTIGVTKSKKPKLCLLPRFKDLLRLQLAGNRDGLDIVQNLTKLEQLGVTSFHNPGFGFLQNMPRLSSLSIFLGGATDLSSIASATSLKDLGIGWVKGLKDISFISQCTNLQRLNLDQLKNVESLPNLEKLNKLRRLTISSMDGLKSVDEISNALSLEVFSGSAKRLDPHHLEKAMQAPSLRAATFYFPSAKKSKEFDALGEKYKICTTPEWEEFIFHNN